MADIRNNQAISKFYKLFAFLKRKGEECSAKKSKILSLEQINKFLTKAQDEKNLITKICCNYWYTWNLPVRKTLPLQI